MSNAVEAVVNLIDCEFAFEDIIVLPEVKASEVKFQPPIVPLLAVILPLKFPLLAYTVPLNIALDADILPAVLKVKLFALIYKF